MCVCVFVFCLHLRLISVSYWSCRLLLLFFAYKIFLTAFFLSATSSYVACICVIVNPSKSPYKLHDNLLWTFSNLTECIFHLVVLTENSLCCCCSQFTVILALFTFNCGFVLHRVHVISQCLICSALLFSIFSCHFFFFTSWLFGCHTFHITSFIYLA